MAAAAAPEARRQLSGDAIIDDLYICDLCIQDLYVYTHTYGGGGDDGGGGDCGGGGGGNGGVGGDGGCGGNDCGGAAAAAATD